jgi:hypothetical protein
VQKDARLSKLADGMQIERRDSVPFTKEDLLEWYEAALSLGLLW